MGPLSLTGQPNAMGGREVGDPANELAAHMGFDEVAIDSVGRFWKAPCTARREGLKAVDLFRAVEAGEIKALWIMATNPVVSLPRAEAVRRALGNLELLVVSDNVLGADTVTLAKVRLPACAWGERRAPSPIPSVASAGSGLSFRRRARRNRTGGSSRKSRGEWATRMRFRMSYPPKSCRTCGALGIRERRRPRFRFRRAGDA